MRTVVKNGLRLGLVSLAAVALIGGPLGGSAGGPLAGSSAEPMAAVTLGEMAGFSPGGKLGQLSDRQLAADLGAMADSGAKWVRVDFAWVSSEPRRGEYDWAGLDRVTAAASSAGLKVLALVAYSPAWSRPGCASDKCPPDSPADYVSFVRAVAQRYGPDVVQAWELWNEPNIASFWQPQPDPVRYAALLKAGAAALRETRPDARILSAGVAPADSNGVDYAPVDFIERLYELGAMEHVDIVAVHPYSGSDLPLTPTSHNTFLQMEQVHQVMARNGDGAKPIWGTEFGVATGDDHRGTTEAQQSAIITQGYERLRDRTWPWFTMLFAYSLRDLDDNVSDWQSNFGLLRHDGRQKPGWSAFTESMRLIPAPLPSVTPTAPAES